jgi:vacuolar-type H+-ATPase catalytic subunit A/Vma1
MEEADAKKKALNMEMFQVKVWQKKHEKLQKINEDFKKSILKKEQFIKIFVNEICKLKFMKKNIDSKLKNIQQFYNTIISERDILGAQLIKVKLNFII